MSGRACRARKPASGCRAEAGRWIACRSSPSRAPTIPVNCRGVCGVRLQPDLLRIRLKPDSTSYCKHETALDFVRTSGAAAARDRSLADGLVVVGQLFAALDASSGADPDGLVDDLEPAVRRAGVVDEARDVAADVGVAAPDAI